jgi:hypothetical protein
MDELNEISKVKLGITKPIKSFFAKDGAPVKNFLLIEKFIIN